MGVGRDVRLFPLRAGVGGDTHHVTPQPVDQNMATPDAEEPRKCRLYFGRPCIQLKVGDSITKEEGKNGYWGQLAVSATIAITGDMRMIERLSLPGTKTMPPRPGGQVQAVGWDGARL